MIDIRRLSSGFTLIEMVLTIVIMGILSATVLPRFADTTSFVSTAFGDRVLAALRFAQRTAITQRRTVCVDVAADRVSLRVANTFGSSDCVVGSDLFIPGTETNTVVEDGVVISGAPNSFTINSRGAPSAGQEIRIVGMADTISVEPVTGFSYRRSGPGT